MADARPGDPARAGAFTLSVDGTTIGSFTEVSGLAVQVQTEDLVEGGQNQFVHKLPRGMSWQNLVFKRGVTDSDSLFAWLAECSGDGFAGQGNRLKPRTATIAVLDAAGARMHSWTVEGAFPVRWTGPTLAASANELAVEQLEVCHRGFVGG